MPAYYHHWRRTLNRRVGHTNTHAPAVYEGRRLNRVFFITHFNIFPDTLPFYYLLISLSTFLRNIISKLYGGSMFLLPKLLCSRRNKLSIFLFIFCQIQINICQNVVSLLKTICVFCIHRTHAIFYHYTSKSFQLPTFLEKLIRTMSILNFYKISVKSHILVFDIYPVFISNRLSYDLLPNNVVTKNRPLIFPLVR